VHRLISIPFSAGRKIFKFTGRFSDLLRSLGAFPFCIWKNSGIEPNKHWSLQQRELLPTFTAFPFNPSIAQKQFYGHQ
jgi:hypothetical protein